MRALEPWHLLVLLVVVLVLFGGKKLPEAARGLGRSMRIFKSEVKEMREDDKPATAAPAPGTGPLEGRVVGAGEPPIPAPAPMRDTDPLRDTERVRTPDEHRPGL